MWTSIYEDLKWKSCSNCKIEKPASDFSKQQVTPKTRKDGLTSWCRLCYSEYFKRPDVQMRRLSKEKEYLKRPHVRQQRKRIYRKHSSKPWTRYSYLLESAKKRNLLVTISFEEWVAFVSPDTCHYCEGNLGHFGMSLDRKYNELGYTQNNVVPCCGECNYMKRDMPYHEFILLSPILREIKKRRKERQVSI